MTLPVTHDAGRLIFVFALAALLRLFVAVPSERVPTADDTGFRDTAWAIAIGEGHILGGRVTFKAPLYPAAMAAVYGIWGRSDRAVRIAQAILGASVCLIVFWLATLMFDRRAALIASLVLAVHPIFLALTDRLLAENLFIWLVALAIWAAASMCTAPSSRKAVLLGALCGLVALTRSIGVGLAVVLAVCFTFYRWRQDSVRLELGRAALILATCAVVVAPWAVRNFVKLDAFVPISTELGRNLYSGWVSVPEDKRFGFTAVDATTRVADTLPEVESDQYLLSKAVEHISAHPEMVPSYMFLKSLYFWSPIDWDVVGHGEGVYNGMYVAMAPFLLLGIWKARERAPLVFWLCVPVVVYFWCIALVGTTTPRYRYPIEPMLLPVAGFGVVQFFEHASDWRRRAAVVVPWVAVNVIAIAFSGHVKAGLRDVLVYAGIW
jgi:4-amino-4-deoxy-L-arabinose transferase-like glycosyltransferase